MLTSTGISSLVCSAFLSNSNAFLCLIHASQILCWHSLSLHEIDYPGWDCVHSQILWWYPPQRAPDVFLNEAVSKAVVSSTLRIDDERLVCPRVVLSKVAVNCLRVNSLLAGELLNYLTVTLEWNMPLKCRWPSWLNAAILSPWGVLLALSESPCGYGCFIQQVHHCRRNYLLQYKAGVTTCRKFLLIVHGS